MERTAAARTRDAPRRRAAVTMEQIEAFLRSLERRGRAAGTIQAYRRSLTRFYQALPPDKRVCRDTLSRWRDDLLAQGYTARTVNAALSAANSLLDFLGQRECQLVRRLAVADQAQPELDRREYLRLLSAARAQGNERAYLLVKVFAVTGIPVHGLPELTVEAVRANALAPEPGGPRRPIPASLREELLAYIRRRELTGGPVFVTRSGRPLSRTAVTAAIQSLAGDAQVAPEKCNPRCLRKLCQTTLAEIEADVRRLVEQTRDQLLEQEQRLVG